MTTDWQPIDTAPRDGTEILAWCVIGERGFIDLVDYESWESAGVMQGMWSSASGYYLRKPTHWMPLPPAPKEASDGN